MPFYEFYCGACHRIFNFYSRKIETEKTPNCPRCAANMQRMISSFIALKDIHNNKDTGGFATNDDSQLLKAQMFLASEMQKIDSNNPRQVATVLKKVGDLTGNHLGQELQSILTKIEQGGNINELQLEMENILTKYEERSESEFGTHKEKSSIPPSTDAEVYEL